MYEVPVEYVYQKLVEFVIMAQWIGHQDMNPVISEVFRSILEVSKDKKMARL